MRLPARAPITWFLIGLFVLVAGIGEGFHLIPGCGHYLELPGGYLFVGRAAPKSELCSNAGLPRVGRSQDDSGHRFDEDDCPICRLTAQGKVAAAAVSFSLALPVAHDPATVILPASRARSLQAFDARAPPVA